MLQIMVKTHNDNMELLVLFVTVLFNYASADRDFGGVDLTELEFIVAEMSTTECQQLATAMKDDSQEKDNEEGVTCLDDLLRYESALEAEGSNIARGVFKHMLNRIGRQDLADWLSISKAQTVKSPRNSGDKESKTDSGLSSQKSSWSWYDTAITVALVYTGGILLWLAVHVLVRKITRDQCVAMGDVDQPKQKLKKRKRRPSPENQDADGSIQKDSQDSGNAQEVSSFYHYYRPPKAQQGRHTKTYR